MLLPVFLATTAMLWQRERVAERDDPESPARILHPRPRFWLPSRCAN
jgi:hypothetical protein